MAKVLLIEPDMMLAKNLCAYLEGRGHEVRWRPDAQSAVSAADEVQPDIVVLELQLAQHSGMEFIYEFRSYPDWINTPIIILSSLLDDEVRGTEAFWQQLEIAGYYHKTETNLANLSQAIDRSVRQVRANLAAASL